MIKTLPTYPLDICVWITTDTGLGGLSAVTLLNVFTLRTGQARYPIERRQPFRNALCDPAFAA